MECCFLAPLRVKLAQPFSTACSSSAYLQRRGSCVRWRSGSGGAARCQKMFVPGFGEGSPEAKAARSLQDFFTFVAVKIVLAQLESYNPEAHAELMEFVDRNSLNDGDKFCRALMRESPRHKGLALRILEVRSAYTKRDFEWDNLEKLARKMVDESNTRLMREYVLETSHLDNED
ncbi:chaperonin-like RBCX protein 1, chloroplastic [Iris pallida]|uniref:Chaperonin-like RBCX protein 1, chloroplastic n=1 Tax=Iris pallida TaxID=29817 RepID=A0AAX6DTG4_IRIPA|nr:chaperonin-like RBCX protein 1, chloroplastic [Iris pallida]